MCARSFRISGFQVCSGLVPRRGVLGVFRGVLEVGFAAIGVCRILRILSVGNCKESEFSGALGRCRYRPGRGCVGVYGGGVCYFRIFWV